MSQVREHTAEHPPRGIWYEDGRRRWRVRVYLGNRVVFIRYTRTFVEALVIWEAAKAHKAKVRAGEHRPIGSKLEDQLNALAEGLI